MGKLYTLSEAQKIWTKMIEKQANELKKNLIKSKNKKKLDYV